MFARFQKYVYICTQIVTSGRSYGGFGGGAKCPAGRGFERRKRSITNIYF